MDSIPVKQFLDNDGLTNLINAIAKNIEQMYVPRNIYERDILDLNNKLFAIMEFGTINPFSIDIDSGELSIVATDKTNELDLYMEDGNLYLNSKETELDNLVASYSFNIDDEGYLTITV